MAIDDHWAKLWTSYGLRMGMGGTWQQERSNVLVGEEIRMKLIWCSDFGGTRTRTRSRSESIAAHQREDLYHPTKEQRATGCGLMDVHGNVWEWTCNSKLGEAFAPKASEGSRRCLVGGSWLNNAIYARCGCRIGNYPDLRVDTHGFRIVLR